MGARKKNKKLKRLRAQERKKMFVAYKFSICSQNRSTHWSEIDSIEKRKFKMSKFFYKQWDLVREEQGGGLYAACHLVLEKHHIDIVS